MCLFSHARVVEGVLEAKYRVGLRVYDNCLWPGWQEEFRQVAQGLVSQEFFLHNDNILHPDTTKLKFYCATNAEELAHGKKFLLHNYTVEGSKCVPTKIQQLPQQLAQLLQQAEQFFNVSLLQKDTVCEVIEFLNAGIPRHTDGDNAADRTQIHVLSVGDCCNVWVQLGEKTCNFKSGKGSLYTLCGEANRIPHWKTAGNQVVVVLRKPSLNSGPYDRGEELILRATPTLERVQKLPLKQFGEVLDCTSNPLVALNCRQGGFCHFSSCDASHVIRPGVLLSPSPFTLMHTGVHMGGCPTKALSFLEGKLCSVFLGKGENTLLQQSPLRLRVLYNSKSQTETAGLEASLKERNDVRVVLGRQEKKGGPLHELKKPKVYTYIGCCTVVEVNCHASFFILQGKQEKAICAP